MRALRLKLKLNRLPPSLARFYSILTFQRASVVDPMSGMKYDTIKPLESRVDLRISFTIQRIFLSRQDSEKKSFREVITDIFALNAIYGVASGVFAFLKGTIFKSKYKIRSDLSAAGVSSDDPDKPSKGTGKYGVEADVTAKKKKQPCCRRCNRAIAAFFLKLAADAPADGREGRPDGDRSDDSSNNPSASQEVGEEEVEKEAQAQARELNAARSASVANYTRFAQSSRRVQPSTPADKGWGGGSSPATRGDGSSPSESIKGGGSGRGSPADTVVSAAVAVRGRARRRCGGIDVG